MPMRPKQPCRNPTCGTLVDRGYCPAHTKAMRREVDSRPERVASRLFYRTKAWREARAAYLREHPVCEICDQQPSAMVDHKQTRRERPDLELNPGNFQAACWSCHSEVTAREDGGFGNHRWRSTA